MPPGVNDATANASESAPAENANHPGLPCRSLSNSITTTVVATPSPSSSSSKHATKHPYSKGKPKGEGGDATQRRNNIRQPKSSTFRNPATTKRGEEPMNEKPPGGSTEVKREPVTKRVYRQSGRSGGSGGVRKRPTGGDHTGTSTVSGPSHHGSSNRSNQDPSRMFKRTRSNCSSASEIGRDTQDFRWGVPSPNDNLDTDHSSPQRTPVLPMNVVEETGKTEWPDFSELNNPAVVAREPLISSSLEFTVPHEGEWDEAEEEVFLVGSPPPIPRGGMEWTRGEPLTISPTQRSPPNTLAQCTGDLGQRGTRNLHKH